MAGTALTLFVADSTSLVGNVVAQLAIPWFVLTTTDSPTLTGLAVFFNFLPVVIAAPSGASMATLREDIADLHARLDEGQASAERLPHRSKYLLIVNGFLRRLLDLHLELVDQVERELAADEHARSLS
jgi:hypothetical protein